MYGIDYEIVFKKVIFFNLPHQWRDADVQTEHLIRLANKEEFKLQHQNFDTKDKNIFAIDSWLDRRNLGYLTHTFL